MENRKIYEDIAQRTEGDIYIGVVGPVRTGKSTFIKRFMETLVIPNIENDYKRDRARDELPQSGSGRTIMTAEPKFVPEEAVEVVLEGSAKMSVRLIDCVGYMVDGAIGQSEDGRPRMVRTPWFDYEVPMTEAAELGTRKVIEEHSTIGLVLTTDGTATDLNREGYVEPEERVIEELKALKKPFLVIVNSQYPESPLAQTVCEDIAARHGVTCFAVNCAELSESDVTNIIKSVLFEFPVVEMGIHLPPWVEALPHGHPIKNMLYAAMLEAAADMHRIRDVEAVMENLKQCPDILSVRQDAIHLGSGVAEATVELPRELFYRTLGEQSGFAITDDGDLMDLLSGLAGVKSAYDKVADALRDVRETGYGIVMPGSDELKLEQPEIVKQGGRYGIRLRASAPSIHMLRADIETEVSPIVGTERQSEELVRYLLAEFDDQPDAIWQSNIFGKSLHDLVSEGLSNKLKKMPEDARSKLQETLQRIINEGSGGLICIIL
ncbi:MAG: stage IV sporulation protein A [Oscillospiraceae bacterium]|jgi:stage IV sporulation protein A|nr:stage IV sporulation protein A [Oscillospiraceae bacterium]